VNCRAGCGACCIAPAISAPFHGMPQGKPAGVRCTHLDDGLRCRLFGDPRRPKCCDAFQAERWVCGDTREEALVILAALESETRASV
jgi:Fe-S-cluster containining protein